ncbi:MAG: Two-component system histidine kinase [Glaciihabitans sp.]|jgi:signal transduction histidine kinase|nr:Two-component system histidine kinase [Glaciihabitans sp.]
MQDNSADDLILGWGLSPCSPVPAQGAGVCSEDRDPPWDEALKVSGTRGLAMDDGHSIDFPDEPRGELDLALDNLVARARDVLKIQGRLRSLLRANQAIVEQLDLPVVLERIVASAVELVGAKYGALGVLAIDGSLEQFINVGMTPDQIIAIGHLPEGHGLLGALIDDPHPIRLEKLSDDERSIGFPAGHPPMGAFLGVPVRVRDEVYGNLYLSNEDTRGFSAEDEQLVTALAATAGVAIENARLYAETQRRQAWSAASAEFTANLLSPENGDAIAVLAGRVLELSTADIVWVLLPGANPAELVIAIARGDDEANMQGSFITEIDSVAASIIRSGMPKQVDDGVDLGFVLSDGRSLGPAMAVPLMTDGLAEGVLLVARMHGKLPFAVTDLEMAADFAGQASVAMELEAARADRQRMVILEDRGRIARDLHDHVIQQLFGTGLELQSIAGGLPMGPVSDRIVQSVTNLDATISQIRTIIFALSAQASEAPTSVRHWIIDLANELAPALESTPAVSFAGPVDLIVTNDLADDVLAVAREALVNVIKHAGASHTSVSLAVREGHVYLEIVDDGHGFDEATRRSGVANLEHRAVSRGGVFAVESDSKGTRLLWQVPYETVAA